MESTNIKLEKGKRYKVVSNRKGTFIGKVIDESEDFVTVLITGGMAKAILKENERMVGEEVEVRKTLTFFTKLD